MPLKSSTHLPDDSSRHSHVEGPPPLCDVTALQRQVQLVLRAHVTNAFIRLLTLSYVHVHTHSVSYTIVGRGTYTHSARKVVFFVCGQLDHVPLPTIENVNNPRLHAIKTRTWLDYSPERGELTEMQDWKRGRI